MTSIVRQAPAPRQLAPYTWGVLTLPFGLTTGLSTVAVPFVLREHGLGMTTIATVSQVAQLPHVVKLLWSPLLDAGARRRDWFFLSLAVTAASLAAAAAVDPAASRTALWGYTALLTCANAGVATSGSAVLAMLAVTTPPAKRGAAAGWQTAGNLGGNAMGGAAIAWLLSRSSPWTAVALAVATCAVAAVAALSVDEPPREPTRAWKLAGELRRDIVRTLRSREGRSGMLICLSPVGAGALGNLFGALAHDYGTDEATRMRLAVAVNGVLAGLVNAGGALAGGYAADRMNRRLAYVLGGVATAFCAFAMMLAPATATAFTLGCLGYQFATGLCYAAFYAFVFELVGPRQGVATELALFVGASNLSVTYVTWLDGYGYDRAREALPQLAAAGRLGMLGADAAATVLGVALLWALLRGTNLSKR